MKFAIKNLFKITLILIAGVIMEIFILDKFSNYNYIIAIAIIYALIFSIILSYHFLVYRWYYWILSPILMLLKDFLILTIGTIIYNNNCTISMLFDNYRRFIYSYNAFYLFIIYFVGLLLTIYGSYSIKKYFKLKY